MTATGRGAWRWLAALTSGLAGAGTLIAGLAGGGAAHPAGTGARNGQATLPGVRASALAQAVRGAAATEAEARRSVQRSPGPDRANPGRLWHSSGRSWPAAGQHAPSMVSSVWRARLERRWQEQLAAVTELSLAYHEAADVVRADGHCDGPDGGQRQLRRLLRDAVTARRALADTEDAMARLSAGHFGRCEQCTTVIAARQLGQSPETRYCARCAGVAVALA